MQEQSNQLPPEFDHLRDSEFLEVIIPESSHAKDSDPAPGRNILGLTYAKALIGLAAVVVIVLMAKQLIKPSKQSVSEHYQALEQLDSDPKLEKSKPVESVESKEAIAQTVAATAPETQPSLQHYEMAQADTKREHAAELNQANESSIEMRINQRLGLVEEAVQKLLVANEAHAQSIDMLRNEQAQLMLKMQSNDNALADMRGKIETMQTRIAQPKPAKVITGNTVITANTANTANTAQGQMGQNQPKSKSRDTQKIEQDSAPTKITKTLEVAPVISTPPKPKAQLPVGLRLVSLKNLNGKNTAVIRIGGAFSPMLFEGQSWNGIQILTASVHERAAQVMYQGDEFGLVL